MKEEIAKQRREERELKQLEECTFKPKIVSKSKSPVNETLSNTSAISKTKSNISKSGADHSKSPTPHGYEDSVNRMRMAQKEKER